MRYRALWSCEPRRARRNGYSIVSHQRAGRIVVHALEFVVLEVRIHRPDVVGFAVQVRHGEHGRVHRVILVVVFVHAIPADRVQIGDRIQETAHDGEMVGVRRIVNRVGVGDSYDDGVENRGARPSPRPSSSFVASAISDASSLCQISSPLEQKYSIPRQVRPDSGTSAPLQLLKFCTRPTLKCGV